MTTELISDHWAGSLADLRNRLTAKSITTRQPEPFPVGHEKFWSVTEWQADDGNLARRVGWVCIYDDTGEITVRLCDNVSQRDAIVVYSVAERLRENGELSVWSDGMEKFTTSTGRQCRSRYVSRYILDNTSGLAMPKDSEYLTNYDDDIAETDDGSATRTTFAESLGSEAVAKIQSDNSATAANWLVAVGLELNSRPLITLGRWANSATKCKVTVAAGRTEMADGYAVLCDLHSDAVSFVSIAADAPLDRVTAELWQAAELFRKSGAGLWFGPQIERHEIWCAKDHDLEPYDDCQVVVGVVGDESGKVEVRVNRSRMSGQWDGEATVSVDGDIYCLTPAETAQLARLMVRGSDIAAGLYVAAAVDGDRQVA